MNPQKLTNAGLLVPCVLAGVTGLMLASASAAEAPKPDPKAAAAAAAAALTNRVESVFVWDPKSKGFGRDPFYPMTGRFTEVPPPEAAKPATPADTGKPAPPPPPPKVELSLQGLVGGRIAIINGKSFSLGDDGMVNIPAGGKVRIRVDAIKDGVVSVSIFSPDKPADKPEKRDLIIKQKQ